MSATGARVVIGFDLGSTATKIVLRNHALPEESWAAEFPSGFSLADARLLRTAIVETAEGFALPSKTCTDAVSVKEILLPGGAAEGLIAAGEARAAAYTAFALALALVSGADWMARQGGVTRWHLVIGVPIGSIDDSSVTDRARRIAAAGWLLAVRHLAGDPAHVELRREDVESALTEAREAVSAEDRELAAGLWADSVEAYPEGLAALFGYAHEADLPQGLALVLDVGGRTADFAAVTLGGRRRDEQGDVERVQRIWTSEVQPYLGVQSYYEYQLASMPAALERELRGRWLADLQGERTPELPADLDDDLQSYLTQMGYAFQGVITTWIGGLIRDTRRTRVGLPGWPAVANLMVAGGGAAVNFVQSAVETLCNQVNRNRAGFELVGVFAPDQTTTAGSHRYWVAQGLCLPEVERPVLRPGQIKSLGELETAPRAERFVGKEMV